MPNGSRDRPGQSTRNLSSDYVLAMIDLRRGDYASARSHFTRLAPKMLDSGSLEIRTYEINLAPDLTFILRMTGEAERATQVLDRAREVITAMPRLSEDGYGIADVRIHALRGERPRHSSCFVRPHKPAGASIGATTEISTPFSPRSARTPNSKLSSPTSNATWHASAPSSPPDRGRAARSRGCLLRHSPEDDHVPTNCGKH